MKRSRQQLRVFRENRLSAIRDYVGKWYSEDGSPQKQPANLLELALTIYMQNLAPQAPQCLVTTSHRELMWRAANLELGVNKTMLDINLGHTYRQAVMEALFCWAFVKTGMAQGPDVEINGVKHNVGQFFADVVSIDDWVHDMTARRYEEASFAGNRYRIPLDYVKKCGLYENVGDLGATHKSHITQDGDERAESVSQGDTADEDEYEDHIELWDIWLPREQLVLTIPLDTDRVIRTVEWDGPEQGPYYPLGFHEVPGNMIPLAPVALWRDLNDLVNRLYRKIGRQAERQKEVGGFQGTSAADALRIKNAADGEIVRMDNPNSVQWFKCGGVSSTSMAVTIHMKDLATYLWGNLDVMGGLAAQAETLGQEELMSGNASKRLVFMQERVMDFARQITRALAAHLWYDPLIQLPLTKRVPGQEGLVIPTSFNPDIRQGDFLDYNIDIDPYSLRHQTPQQRLQTLTGIFQQFIVPFAPMMEAQGIQINFEGLLRTIARYANLPDLDQILAFGGQPTADRRGPVQTRQAATTRRIEERVNRSTATRVGKDAALVQHLLGSNLQGAEQASMMRPAG